MRKIIVAVLVASMLLTSCGNTKKDTESSVSVGDSGTEISESSTESSEEISEVSKTEKPFVKREGFDAEKIGMTQEEYDKILDSLEYRRNNAQLFTEPVYKMIDTKEHDEIFKFITPFLLLNDTRTSFDSPEKVSDSFLFNASQQFVLRPQWHNPDDTGTSGSFYYNSYYEPKLNFLNYEGSRILEGYPVPLVEKAIVDMFGTELTFDKTKEYPGYAYDEPTDIYIVPGSGFALIEEPVITNIKDEGEQYRVTVAFIVKDFENNFVKLNDGAQDNGMEKITDVDKYLKEEAHQVEIVLKKNGDSFYFISLENQR